MLQSSDNFEGIEDSNRSSQDDERADDKKKVLMPGTLLNQYLQQIIGTATASMNGKKAEFNKAIMRVAGRQDDLINDTALWNAIHIIQGDAGRALTLVDELAPEVDKINKGPHTGAHDEAHPTMSGASFRQEMKKIKKFHEQN